MKKLFIDTHSQEVIVTIITDEKIYKNETTSDRSHSEVVVPLLEKALKEAEIELSNIDEIIVVNGPGSFTGVRIGVTIAKTIAYSLNIPIKTISSLEAYGVSSTSNFDIVIVRDSKGVYSAKKNEDKFEDFIYQKDSEFNNYISEHRYTVLESSFIDYEKILKYLEDKECNNPHLVNPVYIKEIDALK